MRIFLEDLSEMLAFIIQCGGEHGGLLDGLEQLSRNAEVYPCYVSRSLMHESAHASFTVPGFLMLHEHACKCGQEERQARMRCEKDLDDMIQVMHLSVT